MSTRTRPYETLIRHNDDGTVASHHVRIKEYFDDDVEPPELVSAKILPPVPLSGAELESVIGEAFVQATAQIQAMQATIVARDARIAELEAQVAGAQLAEAPPEAPVA